MFHFGNTNFIRPTGGSLDIIAPSSNANIARFIPGGAVELWHNASKKLETTSAGATVTGSLGIGTTSPQRLLQVGSYGSSNGEIAIASATNGYGSILFGDSATGTALYRGYVQYNHTSDKMLLATNSTAQITIESDGTVDVNHHMDIGGGLDVVGNITVTGTVDGIDIAGLNTTVGTKLANVVEDTTPQLGGDLDTNSFEISLDDAHAVKFGDSNDLQIMHSTHNYIYTSNGNIELRSTVGVDEPMIKCKPDNAVELYYNGNKKFETIGSGVSTDGLMNFNGTGDKILIGDNGKISFGGGGDLDIYSDGNNGVINLSSGAGYIQIKNDNGHIYLDAKQGSSNVYLRSGNGTNGLHNSVICNGNGAVELYYQGSQKLYTGSNGVTVNSTLHINGGGISRSAHHVGHLIGSYNNIGDNSYKSNPIYTIGSGYNPADAALSNMYGVGFTNGNASFAPSGAGWGLYVASDGNRRVFLDGSNGRAYIGTGTTYITNYVSGDYGSFQVNGLGANGYEGFSIDGRYVLMHDGGNNGGIYNDVENEWYLYTERGGGTHLYYDGAHKCQSTQYGFDISGTLHFNDTNTAVSEGSGDAVRISTTTGYVDIGSMNSTYCHFNTDRGVFYFNTQLSIAGAILPYGTSGSHDLGSSSARWRNLYVNDLQLSNEHSGGNSVDGTWGDWTLQEAEDTVYMLNNRNGKKYKMALQEVA